MRPLLLLLTLAVFAQEVVPEQASVPTVVEEDPWADAEGSTIPFTDYVLVLTKLMKEERYDEVLHLSLVGTVDYPDKIETLRAFATLAIQQKSRKPTTQSPERLSPSPQRPTAAQRDRPSSPKAPQRIDLSEVPEATQAPVYHPQILDRVDPRTGLLLGFDLGLPTGVRAEYKIGRNIDSVGLRVGANTLIYRGAFLLPDSTFYMDFAGESDWQIEVSGGLVLYYLTPYTQYGLAVQYDPPTALQANVGFRVGPFWQVTPDIGVSFLW